MACLRNILGIVLMLWAVPGSAQENVADSTSKEKATRLLTNDDLPEWHEMVTNVPGDWAKASGFVFRKESLPVLIGIAGVTGVLFASDHETYRFTHRLYERSGFVKSTSDFFVSLGDGKYQFGFAAACAAYGFIGQDRAAIKTASQTVEAVLASGVVVQVLKHITGRESPLAASSGSGAWRFFPSIKEYHKHQARYYAYPSGHIATTMATVTVIIENYPNEQWLKPVGYTVVGLVGLGLVCGSYHWYSDLPLGLALGYTFGTIASHRTSDKNAADGSYRLIISPSMTFEGAGVQFIVVF